MNWKTETPQDRLPMYQAILKDWLTPIEKCRDNFTNWGFCLSIRKNQGIDFYIDNFKAKLPELYRQRKTNERYSYHYDEYGCNRKGRRQRIAALRAAIKETEKAIKKDSRLDVGLAMEKYSIFIFAVDLVLLTALGLYAYFNQ